MIAIINIKEKNVNTDHSTLSAQTGATQGWLGQPHHLYVSNVYNVCTLTDQCTKEITQVEW